MFLILLYATGSTVCELLDLKRGDVYLKKRFIAVYNRKYGWTRMVPIGDDLHALLSEFLQIEYAARKSDTALFADKGGKHISPAQVTYSFARLRRIAGVGPKGKEQSQPRLLDFRTTFAVHRIRAWIKDGVGLNRMLPALAAYMGQAGLGSIDKYMDLTPERFAGHIAILGPTRGRRSWKYDPALAKCLNGPVLSG